MPLYATLHTDYVAGPMPAKDADDPAGTRIIDATDAEQAQEISIGFDLEEPNAASEDPFDYVEETAIVNLDKIFETMREAGYTVTVKPPKPAKPAIEGEKIIVHHGNGCYHFKAVEIRNITAKAGYIRDIGTPVTCYSGQIGKRPVKTVWTYADPNDPERYWNVEEVPAYFIEGPIPEGAVFKTPNEVIAEAIMQNGFKI